MGSPEKHSQGEQKLNKCSKFVWNTFGHAESTTQNEVNSTFWAHQKITKTLQNTAHEALPINTRWCLVGSCVLSYLQKGHMMLLWFLSADLYIKLVGDLLDEKLDPVGVQLNTKQSKEKKKISVQPPRTTRTTSWRVHYGNISCCPWIREEVKVETRYMMTRALCCDTSGTQFSIKPSANRGRHPTCPILTYM